MAIEAGIGVVEPKRIRGMLATPFGGSRNGSDSPDDVRPLLTQVARART